MKAVKGNRKRSRDHGSTGTINSSVSPVHSTIEKLDHEIAKMSKYITDLEQNSKFQNKEIVCLKAKLREQEVISRNFEDENFQLRDELFEAGQSLHQNTGQVQEIVRNVLEIKHLKEELDKENQKNKRLKEELKNEKHENDLKRALIFENSQAIAAASFELSRLQLIANDLEQEKERNSIILNLQNEEIISVEGKLNEQKEISRNLDKDNVVLRTKFCNKIVFVEEKLNHTMYELNEQKEISENLEKENSKLKEEHNDLIIQIFSHDQEQVKSAKEIRHLKEALNYEKEKNNLQKSKVMHRCFAFVKQRNSQILRENENTLSELEQKSLFQKGQIIHVKDKLEEQKVVAKNLENDNTKLRKLLSEARQILKIIENCSLFIHKPDEQEKEKVKEKIKYRNRRKNLAREI